MAVLFGVFNELQVGYASGGSPFVIMHQRVAHTNAADLYVWLRNRLKALRHRPRRCRVLGLLLGGVNKGLEYNLTVVDLLRSLQHTGQNFLFGFG